LANGGGVCARTVAQPKRRAATDNAKRPVRGVMIVTLEAKHA